MITISVAKDFTRTPGPRYKDEGSYSGELFRQTQLVEAARKAIQSGDELFVDLDGTAGYGTSFLEESFGGLIRVEHVPYNQISALLRIKSDERPKYIEEVRKYMARANEKTPVQVCS